MKQKWSFFWIQYFTLPIKAITLTIKKQCWQRQWKDIEESISRLQSFCIFIKILHVDKAVIIEAMCTRWSAYWVGTVRKKFRCIHYPVLNGCISGWSCCNMGLNAHVFKTQLPFIWMLNKMPSVSWVALPLAVPLILFFTMLNGIYTKS